jgi:hypothetical protein
VGDFLNNSVVLASHERLLLQENQFMHYNIPFCRSDVGNQQDVVEATVEWFI